MGTSYNMSWIGDKNVDDNCCLITFVSNCGKHATA